MLAKELAYYRAHFREAVQKDGVVCLECGATFKYLPGHLCKHNLTSEEYRAKYLQQIVKRLAEDKGFKATIEKPVLGGIGSVDVALEKDGRAFGCEISVSTSSEWEFGNIQKCLAAGFERVFVLTQEVKNISRIQEFASTSLEKNDLEKISFLTIEDFISFLEKEEAKGQETEQIVRGRKVKTRHRALSESEKKSRRQAIAQTILQSMRRIKD